GISKINGEYLRAQLGSATTGAISTKQLRLNNELFFQPQMTDFSSRGPIAGLGQIKPDVTAPGLGILSATVRVGAAETNTGTMFDPTGYIHASGTSFSGPHVTGAVTLIKQAHLNYTPDMIRAVLANTSTNLRTDQGVPRGDGNASEPIIAQGGGLVNVAAAVNAKAIMGISGDGIIEPSILASHSFGEANILNNRVVNTRSVTVTLRDTSGQGGTYNLSTANNRYFDLNGASATVSPASVNVPANGSVTFTATVSIDGDKVRDASESKEFQWYVVARRSNSSETLRVPMYWKANPTVPSEGLASIDTQTYTGTVLASDGGVQRDQLEDYVASDITYVDVPFEVGVSALGIDASLDFNSTHIADIPGVGTLGVPDLDFLLYDADGVEIGRSGNGGGPERITAAVTRPGTYTYRVYGWLNPPTDFTITSRQLLGAVPPNVQPFKGDFTDANAKVTDFDGSYTLNWTPAGSVLNYEVEESTDGTNYSVIRTVDGNTNSVSFTGVPNGTRSYRVRSVTPGRTGYFVTLPSNVQSITVDLRGKVDITGTTSSAISNVSLGGGVFRMDLDLTNNSTSSYVPLVELNIVSINSASGTVRAINADNSGNGAGVNNAALYGYSNLIGSDGQFGPTEKTGVRTLQFRDTASEMFSFDAVVTAYQNGGVAPASGGSGSAGTSSSGGGSPSALGLPQLPKILRFTVNPLTKSVTAKLL
ncbi:MAG TPA: S8 family serine peptidase, partial [Pyrinomonadaceae bacterium]|nr:S8 family serine peptidase [Pyrinomonadaceae bacterium]